MPRVGLEPKTAVFLWTKMFHVSGRAATVIGSIHPTFVQINETFFILGNLTFLSFRSYVSFPKATRGLEPISYRRALLSTLLHATVYVSYTICLMYWYRLQIKWDYIKEIWKNEYQYMCRWATRSRISLDNSDSNTRPPGWTTALKFKVWGAGVSIQACELQWCAMNSPSFTHNRPASCNDVPWTAHPSRTTGLRAALMCHEQPILHAQQACELQADVPWIAPALSPGFTQPLTELSTKNRKIIMFMGIKVRPVRRADNLATSVSRLSRQCGIHVSEE
jgi:hypothetical protein